jgi:ubiquinone/menaquinone biosynthesis C-methylase UbiE
MFNNLINLQDFAILFNKIKQRGLLKILLKLRSGNKSRVKMTWQYTTADKKNWWDIPEVNTRLDYLISGDRNISSYDYVSKKYFKEKNSLNCLSLGCGTGGREIKWAEICNNLIIDAYDLSKERIDDANKTAEEKSLQTKLKFHNANVFEINFKKKYYDVIFLEGSLHHFSPLRILFEHINYALKDDGIIIINDFAGPTRFQWSKKQIEITNSVLDLLPDNYKRKININSIKSRVYIPGRLSMYLNDPSEAVESSNILPLLHELFDIIEFKKLGGTILHLLFKDIAYNFLNDEPETKSILELCFYIEDKLLELNVLPSDFIFCVCKKLRNRQG